MTAATVRRSPLVLMDPDVRGEADGGEPLNDVPADIDLPPTAAETGRSRIGVVIAVPVLSPRCDLERTEPPDVLTRIYALGKTRLEMQQAIHETLAMQAVDHSDRADPEQS